MECGIRDVTPGVPQKPKFSIVIIQDSLRSDGRCFMYRRITKLHRHWFRVLALPFSTVVVRTTCDFNTGQSCQLPPSEGEITHVWLEITTCTYGEWSSRASWTSKTYIYTYIYTYYLHVL